MVTGLRRPSLTTVMRRVSTASFVLLVCFTYARDPRLVIVLDTQYIHCANPTDMGKRSSTSSYSRHRNRKYNPIKLPLKIGNGATIEKHIELRDSEDAEQEPEKESGPRGKWIIESLFPNV